MPQLDGGGTAIVSRRSRALSLKLLLGSPFSYGEGLIHGFGTKDSPAAVLRSS